MKSLEIKGKWWLPNDPEKQFYGVLKFEAAQGANLELFGVLSSEIKWDESFEPEIILGLSEEGKPITLYKCIEQQVSSSSIYIVRIIYIGYHFKKEKDIKFHNITVNFTNFEEWLGTSGFKTSYRRHVWNISYSHPKSLDVKIDDIRISLIPHFNLKRPRFNEIYLKQYSIIKIASTKLKKFEDLDEILLRIKKFLTLAIGKPIFILIYRGEKIQNIKKNSKRKEIKNEIEIYLQLSKKPSSRAIHPSEMLFTFSNISDNFNYYLRNWLEKSKTLDPVFDQYFGYVYNTSMYHSDHFLSLIQALESYHRRKDHGQLLGKDEFDSIKENFKNSLPEDLNSEVKKTFIEKFEHINRYSLRRRIKEILKIITNHEFFKIDNKSKFINDLVKTRNDYIHILENPEKKVKKGRELHRLIVLLEFILQICFLREIGIPKEKIDKIFKRNRSFLYNFRKYGY